MLKKKKNPTQLGMDGPDRISKAPCMTRTFARAVARSPHWGGPVAADLGRRHREEVISERVSESEIAAAS